MSARRNKLKCNGKCVLVHVSQRLKQILIIKHYVCKCLELNLLNTFSGLFQLSKHVYFNIWLLHTYLNPIANDQIYSIKPGSLHWKLKMIILKLVTSVCVCACVSTCVSAYVCLCIRPIRIVCVCVCLASVVCVVCVRVRLRVYACIYL